MEENEINSDDWYWSGQEADTKGDDWYWQGQSAANLEPQPKGGEGDPNAVSIGSGAGSKVGSGIAGLSQGSTFGFGDEAAGVMGATSELIPGIEQIRNLYADKVLGVEGAQDLSTDPRSKMEKVLEAYRETRGQGRGFNTERRRANPKSYMGGEILGGVASSAPLGGPLAKIAGSAAGKGQILKGAMNAAKEGAAVGGLYGFGTSEADLTKGEFGDALSDTVDSGSIGALTGGALGGALKIPGAISNKFGRTGAIEKASAKIKKEIERLRSSEAVPEAEIFENLAKGPGTPEGFSTRQRTLMSDGTRQERGIKFLDSAKKANDSIDDSFRQWENNVRPKEVSTNLADVPLERTYQGATEVWQNVKNIIGSAKNKPGFERRFQAGVVDAVDEITDEALNSIRGARSSADIYNAVNDLKKSMSPYMKFGKNVPPEMVETVNLLNNVRRSFDDFLGNESVFGNQATRHKEVNQAYRKFLQSKKMLAKGIMSPEESFAGRPEPVFSSTKMGTYMKQLDTLHGADRIRYFDDFVESAKSLAKVMDDSPVETGDLRGMASRVLKTFENEKSSFTTDLKLSNQLRRIEWGMGRQNAAEGLSGVLPSVGRAAGKVIPGGEMIVNAMNKNTGALPQNKVLLDRLLQAEKKGGVIDNRFLDKLGSLAKKHPQTLGKVGPALAAAAKKGPQALVVTNHVLMQQDAEYREMIRKMNNEKGEI